MFTIIHHEYDEHVKMVLKEFINTNILNSQTI